MASFQTNNQQYGSHYTKSSANKQKIGSSTLQFLKKTDQGGFLHQQQNIAQRERHGLFTQPMTLATGDFYEDKKPQKQQKNMTVNKKMQQKVGPELFQKMSSTNIGDLYKDKFRQKQLYQKQKCDLSVHPRAFIAGGKQKLVHHSEFQHQKEFEDKQYNTKNQDGTVKTGLKNIYTSKMKKGFGNTTVGHLFGAYKYEGTPYDNGRQIQKNEKLIHKAKILKPFTSASKPGQTFTPNYSVFHLENQNYKPKDEQHIYRSKTNQKWKYNNANKKGFYGTFTQFPKYIEEGEIPKQRVNHQKVWKPNFNGTSKNFKETLSRPCPPASQLLLNEMRRTKQ